MDATGAATAVNTFGANGLISRRNISANASVFHAFDERGNVAQYLDRTGRVITARSWDAFGVYSGTTGNPNDPFAFGGQYGYYTDTETAGLILCGLRYYDPSAGRWLTRDPMGYAGGINLYGYVTNNPVMGVDPLGLRPITSSEVAILRGLYTAYYAGDQDVMGEGVTLHRINQVVRTIKAAIGASLDSTLDPPGLAAALWALKKLGHTAWGGDGSIEFPPYSKLGRGQVKCNYFVAGAYIKGAGAMNYPDAGWHLWGHYPASANTLASDQDIINLPADDQFRLGDIVAFANPGDQGHSTLYLDAGLLIYAGPVCVKIWTFNEVYNDGSHTSYKIRRYDGFHKGR